MMVPLGHRSLLISSVLVAGFALGCSYELVEGATADSETTTDTGECYVGALECECTNGGGCDPGLECLEGLCIDAGTETNTDTDTDDCTSIGCNCDDESVCDEGLVCESGICVTTTCGDGVLDPQEQCDDANNFDGDGCDTDCTLTEIEMLALGGLHTCALIEGGRVRCWGSNGTGQIGLGTPGNIGDDEPASAALDLPLPAVVSLSSGGAHTCAILESGDLRCWGFNTSGQLGLGNTGAVFAIGDDEFIDAGSDTELGGPVNQVSLGVVQTCARTSNQLRCWGGGVYGQLGLNSLATIGDDELPTSVEPVMLGGDPAQIAVAGSHGCALMGNGAVRCWGRGDSGQLGYGSTEHIGDNEHPSAAGELSVIPPEQPFGTTILEVGVGLAHSCALLSSNQVICWGSNAFGELGQGNGQSWADEPGEDPSGLAPIELGGSVDQLSVGYQHSCVLLENGDVRCWGNGQGGQLGYGNEDSVGIVDKPVEAEPVKLGGPAIKIYAGGAHSCAILANNDVICWGSNDFGQLGYGYTFDIGDDEFPEIAGTVSIL